MQLANMKALITGGAGGIGSAIAQQILEGGGAVLLIGRDGVALQAVGARLAAHGDRITLLMADLTDAQDVAHVCAGAQRWRGGINVLINNAGMSPFGWLSEQDSAVLERVMVTNVLAPMQLCRALLPHLLQQPAAQILNIGSVFGVIGHPGYAAYSASKFALRGFSEALRREMAATKVTVHYLAPRATRTSLNDVRVTAMNEALGTATDTPERVAICARKLLLRGGREAVVGWPEKLFAKINAVFPGVVDRALGKKLPIIESYARPNAKPRNPNAWMSTSRKSA
jgi:short-subunit dehydrogenase